MKRCGCNSHNGYLTRAGRDLVAQRSLEGLGVADMEITRYLDSRVSVSALNENEDDHVFDDQVIDEQALRVSHGS